MSPEETTELMRDLTALDNAYAKADKQEFRSMLAWLLEHPSEIPPEDEMALLQKAALNRGQP